MGAGTDAHSATSSRWQTQVTLSKPAAGVCRQPVSARHTSIVQGSPSSHAWGPSVRQLVPVGSVVVVVGATMEVVVIDAVDAVVVVVDVVVVVVGGRVVLEVEVVEVGGGALVVVVVGG
jgi:hypothetical protein